MAFSLRKMLSNITYFKKPGEDDGLSGDGAPDPNLMESSHVTGEPSHNITFERTEADSTSKQATSLKLPETVKKIASKKGSLSDTDLVSISLDSRSNRENRRSKKLKLDITKANKSMDEYINFTQDTDDVENTPKHILLECKSSDFFSEKIRKFDLSKSFDIFDAMLDDESTTFEEENIDIESLSDSDTEISIASNHDEKSNIKMCRKVGESESHSEEDRQLVPSASLESFGDVEIDQNEEERITLLLNYQTKLEKMECILKKLLGEFSFHIEVSKVFHCRSIVTALPGTDVKNIPKILGEVTYMDLNRGISPTGSWNMVLEKEDDIMKFKLKKQLLSMKHSIDQFVKTNLKNSIEYNDRSKSVTARNRRSFTPDLFKGKRMPQKRLRLNTKKKLKHFDFPDFRDSMINLFNVDSDDDSSVSANNIMSDFDESDLSKCHCRCHMQTPSSQTDSGVTTKSDDRSMSITSSLGNFSLDSTTLTAYSESLDMVVSYNSFQDTSLYSALLQKAAIERITFYVQVHSIQLQCEVTDQEYESKNAITFHCPTCKTTEVEENGLLKHILTQTHCEKIHFQYKTAYIKKCVQAGKEILPSTVLNPMKMYRDDNKIVCFGDAVYACSLCFEHMIVGESVLMTHCLESEHMERREKLGEILV